MQALKGRPTTITRLTLSPSDWTESQTTPPPLDRLTNQSVLARGQTGTLPTTGRARRLGDKQHQISRGDNYNKFYLLLLFDHRGLGFWGVIGGLYVHTLV